MFESTASIDRACISFFVQSCKRRGLLTKVPTCTKRASNVHNPTLQDAIGVSRMNQSHEPFSWKTLPSTDAKRRVCLTSCLGYTMSLFVTTLSSW